MKQLAQPSSAIAARASAEVDFSQRFIGFVPQFRCGVDKVDLYSLAEVALFLDDPAARLDHATLADWIEAAVGDDELAGCVREATASARCGKDASCAALALIRQRLGQCQPAAACSLAIDERASKGP